MRFKLQSVGWWVVILGIAILVLFVWMTGVTLTDYSFSADASAGIIVAVFGVLVTLLVGYQIYNAIEIKDEVKRLDKGYEEIRAEAQKEIRLNRNLSNAMLEYFHSEYWAKEGDLNGEFFSLAKTIKFLLLSEWERFGIKEEESLLDLCLARLESCIRKICESKDPELIKAFVGNNGNIITKELGNLVKDPAYNTSKFYMDIMVRISGIVVEIYKKYYGV